MEEIIKPFRLLSEEERANLGQEQSPKQMIKPFTIDTEKAKVKLYLILKVYNGRSDNEEDTRDWEFFSGTSQELYDHIKLELTNDDTLDVMKSMIFVDNPNITIGTKNVSVFVILRSLLDRKKVVDDTDFDLNDYYYDTGDCEEEHGEEQ